MKAKLEKKSIVRKNALKNVNYLVMLFANEGTKSNGTSACQAAQTPKCKNSGGCRSII